MHNGRPARILHEHCRSGHELRSLESASQTTYIRFDLSSIPADYSGANIPKLRRYKVIQLQPVAGSEDQVVEITNPLKEILNIALI